MGYWVGGTKICNCEEPDRATPVLRSPTLFVGRSTLPKGVGSEAEGSQSPVEKRGDCFAEFILRPTEGLMTYNFKLRLDRPMCWPDLDPFLRYEEVSRRFAICDDEFLAPTESLSPTRPNQRDV